jgi:AraC-like DNA-binding protein
MLRVRDAIDRDFAEELALETLAALAHVSPDHLVRTFRSVFGETPHRYLQRRRIERAMFLLRTTELPVTDAGPHVVRDGLDASQYPHTSVDFEEASSGRRRLASPT